jgi:cell division protein FtsB
MWKQILNKWFRLIIKYKFWVSLGLFLFWSLIIDSNNYFTRKEMKVEIHELESQKDYYVKKISEDSVRLYYLKSDNEVLEKFAREQYLMKKANEDLFIIVEK